jgi:hypothetical protein
VPSSFAPSLLRWASIDRAVFDDPCDRAALWVQEYLQRGIPLMLSAGTAGCGPGEITHALVALDGVLYMTETPFMCGVSRDAFHLAPIANGEPLQSAKVRHACRRAIHLPREGASKARGIREILRQ